MVLPPLLAALDAGPTGGIAVGTGATLSWPAVGRRARGLAHHWRGFAGQRVGLLLASPPEFAVGLFGALGAGALVMPLPGGLPPAALADHVKRFRLDHVVDVLPDVPNQDRWPDVAPGVVALLTSGSTGAAAAAVLSQAALHANALGIVATLHHTAAERTLCVPPPQHAYGLSVLLSHLVCGGTVVTEPHSAFPVRILETAAQAACTCLAAVPTTYLLLTQRDNPLSTMRPPTLQKATVAGGALPPAVLGKVRAALGDAALHVMYGQTEACARLTCLPPTDLDAAPGSCGRALPDVTLRISDDGEVLARGPNLMDGYLDEPERSATALKDGWLHTGDLGHLDGDGRLFLTGRRKHMLKVGATRVAPLAVEAVLMGLPGVDAVAVTGMPDPLLGEVAVAFVVGTANDAALAAHAALNLGPMERPRRYVRLDALPRLPGGKVDVVALTARAAALARR
jgi:long-chain acyl-CoA synthetase